jgi:hypothetical protein
MACQHCNPPTDLFWSLLHCEKCGQPCAPSPLFAAFRASREVEDTEVLEYLAGLSARDRKQKLLPSLAAQWKSDARLTEKQVAWIYYLIGALSHEEVMQIL